MFVLLVLALVLRSRGASGSSGSSGSSSSNSGKLQDAAALASLQHGFG